MTVDFRSYYQQAVYPHGTLWLGYRENAPKTKKRGNGTAFSFRCDTAAILVAAGGITWQNWFSFPLKWSRPTWSVSATAAATMAVAT